MTSERDWTVRIDDLCVSFGGRGGRTDAVAGVSFDLTPGETFALVGESGSGKSVTALSILRLLPEAQARIDRGRVLFGQSGAEARDLLRAGERELRRVRGGDIAMIFQEPMTSLNPVMTVGEQIAEVVRVHRGVGRRDARRAAAAAMEEVGIEHAAQRLSSYPHEFSGGMRQRVMIAMALACDPKVLIADEPTTALDVTVQAKVLDLIDRLRADRGIAVLLISHDLPLVGERATQLGVMYAGRLLECGRAERVLREPKHPFTRGLLGCTPSIGSRASRLQTIGDVLEREISRGVDRRRVRPWWPTDSAGNALPAAESERRGDNEHWVLARIEHPVTA